MKPVALIAMLFLCMACSAPLKTKGLRFARGMPMDLPGLGAFGVAIGATHQIEVQNKGSIYKFPAQVEIEADRWVIVGLTPVGSRAFTLVYDGATVTYDAIPFFNLPLPPDTFLLAYALLTLPQDDLKSHLETMGYSLVNQAETLEIKHGEDALARYFGAQANRAGAEGILQHLQLGYWLKVKTLQWQIYEDGG